MKKTIQLLCLLVAAAVPAVAQKEDKLIIPIGKQGRIVYDLNKGVYDLRFAGVASSEGVYAQCRNGASVYDSRSYPVHRYTVASVSGPLGKVKVYTIRHGEEMLQRFYVFAGRDYFLTDVALRADSCGWMAPFASGHTTLDAHGDNRALCVPFDNDMWVRYKAIKLEGARYTGSEVTAIYDEKGHGGFVLGSVKQDMWKTGISVHGVSEAQVDSMVLYGGLSDSVITHDHIAHGYVRAEGGLCHSPLVLVGGFRDWRDGMETYARVDSLLQPKVVFSWNKAVPMGWNSWGALGDKLSFDKAKAVVEFFADSLSGFRNGDHTLYIDLDAFWDNMTPGGITGDLSKLTGFVSLCHARGFRPGIYWTPFADWGKWDRAIEGSHFGYAATWTTQHGKPMDVDGGRAMDPTHPGTRERIVFVLSKLKALGFEMIKIDFLGHGVLESDHFYDPTVHTGMQAFNQGMALVDSVLGGQMLVYAAISPNVATARYVHMRRIGCDAFSAIDNTEYTLNSAGYGWWQHGIYDFADADHVVFNTLPDADNRARLVSSIVTGSLVVGDNYGETGKWRGTARSLLQNELLLGLVAGRARFRPVFAGTGDRGVEVFEGVSAGRRYYAAVNYGDALKTYVIPCASGTKRFKELFSGRVLESGEGVIRVEVAAHDAVVLKMD